MYTMRSYLTFVCVFELISIMFCDKMNDNIGSSLQLQELLQREITRVKEIRKYLALLQAEKVKVENFLKQNDHILPKTKTGDMLFIPLQIYTKVHAQFAFFA